MDKEGAKLQYRRIRVHPNGPNNTPIIGPGARESVIDLEIDWDGGIIKATAHDGIIEDVWQTAPWGSDKIGTVVAQKDGEDKQDVGGVGDTIRSIPITTIFTPPVRQGKTIDYVRPGMATAVRGDVTTQVDTKSNTIVSYGKMQDGKSAWLAIGSSGNVRITIDISGSKATNISFADHADESPK